jgi:hypothetical protein
MSGVPRSQVLLRHQADVAEVSGVWVCPDNFITLVKYARLANTGSAAAVVQILANSPDLASVFLVWMMTMQPQTQEEWNGWFVLNPRDSIEVYCGGAGVQVWLSGAVLAGPPQFPPALRQSPRVEPHG